MSLASVPHYAQDVLPDGTYCDVPGWFQCYHCGYAWGGSATIGRGIMLGGYVLHTECYPKAVAVKMATEQLNSTKVQEIKPTKTYPRPDEPFHMSGGKPKT